LSACRQEKKSDRKRVVGPPGLGVQIDVPHRATIDEQRWHAWISGVTVPSSAMLDGDRCTAIGRAAAAAVAGAGA